MSLSRKKYLGWEEYFMKMAELNAQRSKDPKTQVGACLVDSQNRILGNGYNGMPRGCSDDEFPWNSPEKHLYVCHAEMNTLMNVNNWTLVPKARLYTTLFPCHECAKMIIQSGVSEVIYKDIKPQHFEASRRMFESAGIEFRKFTTDKNTHTNPSTISGVIPGERTINLLEREAKSQPNSSFFDKILKIFPERVLWSVLFATISLEAYKRAKIPLFS